MRLSAFSSRNLKELTREPLMAVFAIGFPVIVLLLLSLIQKNIPVSLFEISSLTPGMAFFGLSFITLYAGSLIAKDRTSSFLMRLFASPLTASDYIFGYILPIFPLAVLQIAVCYIVALFLGLKMNLNVLLSVVVLLPAAVLFIGLGLLFGCLVSDKAVGGLSSLIVNVGAWLGGAWFDIGLLGKTAKGICYMLPFVNAVDAGRAALQGNYADIMPHLIWVIGYAAVILFLAIIIFRKKMKG